MEASRPNATPCLEMAHVLFMDVVAYSTLPIDHQHQLLAELQGIVRRTLEFTRAEAGDQLIRLPTGDGMALVFFRDPEAPVRCALEISRELLNHSQIKLRMGIHTGPVYRVADINANNNVAGGGINIAQRVMDCGDAGHILLSIAEAEVVSQVSAWSGALHDLGEVEVKHGVHVHLYNLCAQGAGNPEIPKKIRAQKVGSAAAVAPRRTINLSKVMIVTAACLLLAAVGSWLLFSRKAHALTEKDTIVLSDFENKTGDTVFDGTLRQALATQLEQSPFLRIIPDDQLEQTLQLMGLNSNSKLTPEVARVVCQRTRSAALLEGSIAQIGSPYFLTIKAVNIANGTLLARSEAQASDKNHVLEALGSMASEIRRKLGESLKTVEKFRTPLEEATTPSLDALKAYTMGVKAQRERGNAEAIPFFQRALELDPKFALAYSDLGVSYSNLGQTGLAAENFEKAYALRNRVSEEERYSIEALYYWFVAGDLDHARDTYRLWATSYPRDSVPHSNLGSLYNLLGEYEKSVSETRETIQLASKLEPAYSNLAASLLALDQAAAARQAVEEAQEQNLDNEGLHWVKYQLAFYEGNSAEMDRELDWAKTDPASEHVLLSFKSDTAAYFGRLAEARDLSRRAVASAVQVRARETAALWRVNAALREAEFGNGAVAHRDVAEALNLAPDRDVKPLAALASARIGDVKHAKLLAEELGRDYQSDTMLRFYWLPTVRAAMELNANRLSEALMCLEETTRYEFGSPPQLQAGTLYPVYLRGQAQLAAHQGNEAAIEFRKIVSHPGIVLNEPIGALARLGLARAYVAQGDTVKARAAYEDFLKLWKDADPDVPILKKAKVEYSTLQ